jgi:hypothetical protein
VCSVVVLRLCGVPAGVCGDAGVVGGGWWCGGVGVEEGESVGGRWCRVSVGWQSARDCCGLWEETGGGSDGAQTGQGRSKPKPASKAVCQGERQKVAVRERQTPANNRSHATSTSMG